MRGHPRRPALLAGALAGVLALATFLVVHHVWIVPIWFVAPLGLPFALGGGVLGGWMYDELRPSIPRGAWAAPAVAALLLLPMLPAEAIVWVRGGAESSEDFDARFTTAKIAQATVELGLGALVVGAALGWRLGRTRRAASATALAALVFGVSLGHNIPFLGEGPGLPKLAVLVLAPTAVAAWTLVLVERRLARGAGDA